MASTRDFSILLIDDSLSDRLIIKAFLAEMGFFRVQEATDGKMAIFKLENAKVQLIITDWKMPVMSGLTLLQELQKDIRFKKIPVIFFTGMNDKADVQSAIKSGVKDYMIKPVNKDDLQAKIKKLFPKLEWARFPKRP